MNYVENLDPHSDQAQDRQHIESPFYWWGFHTTMAIHNAQRRNLKLNVGVYVNEKYLHKIYIILSNAELFTLSSYK